MTIHRLLPELQVRSPTPVPLCVFVSYFPLRELESFMFILVVRPLSRTCLKVSIIFCNFCLEFSEASKLHISLYWKNFRENFLHYFNYYLSSLPSTSWISIISIIIIIPIPSNSNIQAFDHLHHCHEPLLFRLFQFPSLWIFDVCFLLFLHVVFQVRLRHRFLPRWSPLSSGRFVLAVLSLLTSRSL